MRATRSRGSAPTLKLTSDDDDEMEKTANKSQSESVPEDESDDCEEFPKSVENKSKVMKSSAKIQSSDDLFNTLLKYSSKPQIKSGNEKGSEDVESDVEANLMINGKKRKRSSDENLKPRKKKSGHHEKRETGSSVSCSTSNDENDLEGKTNNKSTNQMSESEDENELGSKKKSKLSKKIRGESKIPKDCEESDDDCEIDEKEDPEMKKLNLTKNKRSSGENDKVVEDSDDKQADLCDEQGGILDEQDEQCEEKVKEKKDADPKKDQDTFLSKKRTKKSKTSKNSFHPNDCDQSDGPADGIEDPGKEIKKKKKVKRKKTKTPKKKSLSRSKVSSDSDKSDDDDLRHGQNGSVQDALQDSDETKSPTDKSTKVASTNPTDQDLPLVDSDESNSRTLESATVASPILTDQDLPLLDSDESNSLTEESSKVASANLTDQDLPLPDSDETNSPLTVQSAKVASENPTDQDLPLPDSNKTISPTVESAKVASANLTDQDLPPPDSDEPEIQRVEGAKEKTANLIGNQDSDRDEKKGDNELNNKESDVYIESLEEKPNSEQKEISAKTQPDLCNTNVAEDKRSEGDSDSDFPIRSKKSNNRKGKKRNRKNRGWSKRNRLLSEGESDFESLNEGVGTVGEKPKSENGTQPIDERTSNRPLRSSFCKALVKMTHNLFDDHQIAPKPERVLSEEELEAAIKFCRSKTVRVNLEDVKSDKSLKEPYEAAMTYWNEVGKFKPISLEPPKPKPKPTPAKQTKKVSRNMTKGEADMMETTELLFHNHFAAFSSYPSPASRSRALVSFLIDEHRVKCDRCDGTLDKNGKPSINSKLKNIASQMSNASQFSGYGKANPIRLENENAVLKQQLADREKKIKILESRLKVLGQSLDPDDVKYEDIAEMLSGVQEPSSTHVGNKFQIVQGYRLLDMRIFSTALHASQKCKHGNLVLVELHRDVQPTEDLASRFAFVCSSCGPKTIFPSSSFSRIHPENYSINKQILPLLGPCAYYRLCEFIQTHEEPKDFHLPSSAFGVKAQMVVSVDNALYNLHRPFDPPIPTDPAGNICNGATVQTITQSTNTVPLRLKAASDLISVPSTPIVIFPLTSASSSGLTTTSAQKPSSVIQGQISVQNSTASVSTPMISLLQRGGTTTTSSTPPIVLTTQSQPLVIPQHVWNSQIPIRPSSLLATAASNPIRLSVSRTPTPTFSVPNGATCVRKIRPCDELPKGSQVVVIKPGTRLVSNNVTYSTMEKTGLGGGVYRVTLQDKTERILVINQNGSMPTPSAIVTPLTSQNMVVTPTVRVQGHFSQPVSTPSETSLPTISGVCSLNSALDVDQTSGQLRIVLAPVCSDAISSTAATMTTAVTTTAATTTAATPVVTVIPTVAQRDSQSPDSIAASTADDDDDTCINADSITSEDVDQFLQLMT